MFEEFLINYKERIPDSGVHEKVLLHGHCHTKALVGDGPTKEILEQVGYKVEVLSTGCCGMAGSFGYENDHYEVSRKIGELVLFPVLRKNEDKKICAPGFSCRHQIKDGVNRKAFHPAELIAYSIS